MLNKAIIVLGMHRSGTSAVAGALRCMGVDFGLKEQLIGGQAGVNAKGFWEHRKIVMWNEQLLTALGSSWDDIREVDSKLFALDEVCEIKDKIKMQLSRDFSKVPLWGLKDPRICKLLPLWLDIFKEINVEPSFVIVYRHPEEVAKSLEKRDAFSREKSYALWLSYVFPSEYLSVNYPRTFVAYDRLLNDCSETIKRAFRDLSISFDHHLLNSNEIATFLSPSLRHMVSGNESLKDQKSVWVQKVYHELLRYSDGGADDVARRELARLRGSVQIALGLFVPMIFNQDSAIVELDVLRREHSCLITDYEKIKEAYEQTKEAYEQTKEAYEQIKEAYEQIKGAYEQIKGAYEHTKGAYEHTKGVYEQIKGAYEQIKGAYEHTKGAYEHTKRAYEHTNEELNQVQGELELMKGKISWKICNKLGM